MGLLQSCFKASFFYDQRSWKIQELWGGATTSFCSTFQSPLRSYWTLLLISYPVCKKWCLFHEKPSQEIVLYVLWSRGKDELPNLFHSWCFVTKVEMNENDWVGTPGLQAWKTVGNRWVWNGFNLLYGSQPLIRCFLLTFRKESKHFQNGCSWKEPVLEDLRFLLTLSNGVLLWRSGRGREQNCGAYGQSDILMRTWMDYTLSDGLPNGTRAWRCYGMTKARTWYDESSLENTVALSTLRILSIDFSLCDLNINKVDIDWTKGW